MKYPKRPRRQTQATSNSEQFYVASSQFEPAYMKLHRSGELEKRAKAALERLTHCLVCPRDCGIDRMADQTAVCHTGRYAIVSSNFPHFGEEDCLRGWSGSGTIFFSLCNLKCVFCFHPDTLIPTDAGLTHIADLFEQGENEVARHADEVRFMDEHVQVVTRQGTHAPVVKAFRHHYAGELITLKPYNCPPIHLTPNHEVFVVPRAEPDTVVKVRADQLVKGMYLIVPKRAPLDDKVIIDVSDVLSAQGGRFRKARTRAAAAQLAPLFAEKRTSYALAEMTGYHPAYVRKLRGEWKRGELSVNDDGWVENVLVEEEEWIRFKTERRPAIPARIELDERLAWLLGIYCAEGHVTSQKGRPNSHRLILSFGKNEEDLANRAKHLLEEVFGVQCRLYWRRTTVTVEVGKASLALLFSNLCGKGAHAKQVPPVLRRASADVIRAFLQGVFDGDGYDNGTHDVVNTVSEKFALGLFELGLLLGILPSYHRWEPAPTKVIEGRTVNQSPLYYVKFPRVNPDTGQLRIRWPERPDCFLVPIHKLERMPYEGPVYNLEVDDPDHSYLAPFVAVSNCQNYDISQVESGDEVRPERLAAMMLELQAIGCHNINFVTPEHVVPQILEALPLAVQGGLRLPIVYNTSAYDSLDSLQLLDGIVDIYMPDFKFWDERLSLRFLKARDYPQAARRTVKEMHRQVGPLQFDEHGLAKRGVLVRHLVMPGQIAGTAEIMRFLADQVSTDTYVNIMAQYYPAGKVGRKDHRETYEEINRHITNPEYEDAIKAAHDAGLQRLDQRIPRRPGLLWN